MKTIATTFALVTVAGLTGTVAPVHAQYPTSPPPAMPMRQLQLPPFNTFELPNGLEVVLVRDTDLPIVIASLSMPAGSANDPAGKEGLASLVADVLLKGTETRSAEQIAAEIEGVGAELNAGAGRDFFTVGTAVLKQHVSLAFELIGDVILHATFPEEEVSLSRQRSASAARVQESQPAFLAGKFFSAALYGADHPYGRTATVETIEAAARDDVVAFANTWLRPGGSILILAGDLSVDEARRLTDQHLGSWMGRAPAPTETATPPATPTEILLVNRPGSQQSNILVGNLTMRPGDEDYYAAVVANRILGGGGDARLFKILREDKGWTYGAYSSHNRPRGVARFQANTEVRTEVTDSALAEILHQVRRMRTEVVPDSELVAARGFLLGSFPLQIQTPQQVAGQVRTVRQLDLGDDYLANYRPRLAAIGTDEIMDVSTRLMKPDSLVIVVVGDGKAVYDGLAAIAPVRIIDATGAPLTVSDLNPAMTAVTFDPSRIVTRRDSFSVLVQGNPFGTSVIAYEVEGEAVRATRSLTLPGFIDQSSTLDADAATLGVRSFEMTGTARGLDMFMNIQYAEGRVTGESRQPNPQTGQVDSVTIDTELEAGTIDDNALQLFVGSLPLADGASFNIQTFDASSNATRPVSVAVSEAGTVTVPAGSYDAWLVAFRGGEVGFDYTVAKESGQIIRMTFVGQPLVFELVTSN